jgi:WD40 repeat protein
MGLRDIYEGRQSWADYLSSQPQFDGLTEVLQRRGNKRGAIERQSDSGFVKLKLSSRNYQLALESGLGAVNDDIIQSAPDSEYNLELSFEKLTGGIGQLGADFNLLMGDLIWKFEMCQETLNNILQEIRLAEFEREARAYRSRAERAYLNGWYEEALSDFLEAEKRNYPDFAVHRSIASIYLYHLIDPPKAQAYFTKAAKYARPSDPRQSAEAHYFAGIACLVQQQLNEAYVHLQEAVKLDHELFEAHYQQACLAVRLSNVELAIESLKSAIKGDARYYERARVDSSFDEVRLQVQDLLDQLMQPVQEKVVEVKQDAEALRGYVIAKPEEEKLVDVFHEVEQQMAAGITYRTGLQVLKTLSQVQEELRGIHDRFYKKYEIDPRDYVRSVAFSNDGGLLASGFLNGGIQVWDVVSGLQVYSQIGHLASVNSVVFSPDNLWLVSGSRDRKIKLWESESGREIQTLSGHTGEVRSVAFSPDGQWLVSGSHDKTIRIWRVATGNEVQILEGHAQQVTSTVFNHDGSLIASGSWDKTIKLWDLSTGRVIRTLTGHLKGVASLAFSPDGRWLASGSEDAEVKLWEVSSGREVRSFKDHHNSVSSVAFSPDGGLLAAGSLGQTIIVWKAATGHVVKRLKFQNISYNSVAFSPRGQWMALGSRDLQLWLKVILTEEEYEAVKEGEARACYARKLAEERQLPLYVSAARALRLNERKKTF